MPKKTKKSKASKSTGLKRRFDLTNKKVQFFVVIGIVAVLGGGWFTYKSFAGPVSYLQQQCLPSNCLNAKTLGKTAFNGNDPQKNNLQFYKLTPSGTAYTSKLTIPSQQTLRYCVQIKGDRSTSVKGGIGFDARGGEWEVPVKTSWTDYCTWDQGPWTATLSNATFSIYNSSNTNIYVSKIYVMTDKPPVSSSPNK